MLIFETERLFVKEYTIEDFPIFYRLNGDEELMQYIRPVQSEQGTRSFFSQVIKAYSSQPGLGRWAIFTRSGNEFVGSFAVIPIEVSVDDLQLGYALLQEHWGKGYADESVKEGLNYAFKKLGLQSIAGITEAANIASQKVLLKNGFELEKTYEEKQRLLHLYRRFNN